MRTDRPAPGEVLQYLLTRGVPYTHAVGIAANIEKESGFNPAALGDSGTSYGLFQHRGDRLAGLQRTGRAGDWRAQVDYALQEPEAVAYAAQSFASPVDAAEWWTRKFERPKAEYADKRVNEWRAGGMNDFERRIQLAQAGVSDVPIRAIEPQAPMPAPRMMNMDYGAMPGQGGSFIDNPWLLLGASILANNDSRNTGKVLGKGLLTGMGAINAQRQQREAAEFRRMQMELAQRRALEAQQREQALQQWTGSLPPEYQTLAQIDPDAVVGAMLRQPAQRYQAADGRVLDTWTGELSGGAPAGGTILQHPNFGAFAKEFDLARYQPASVKAAVEAGDPGMLREQPNFDAVMGQRERFERQLSPLRAASQAAKQIDTLVQNPGPFSDIATVYSVIRFLDPQSVVRESEVALIERAAPVFDRLQTLFKRVKDGGSVSAAMRADIRATLRNLTRVYQDNAARLKTEITGLADRYGVDPGVWTGSDIDFPAFTGAESSGYSQPVPAGGQLYRKNLRTGQWEEQ